MIAARRRSRCMLGRFRILALIAVFAAIAIGCQKPTAAPTNPTNSVPTPAGMPNKPSLTVSATTPQPGAVQFTVTTNLPTPLAAMASLDLQGQKDSDTAIGTSKKVALTGPTTVFLIQAVNDVDAMDGKSLPTGSYDASVLIGTKWDENKSIANLSENLEAKQTIKLHSDRTTAFVKQKNELQTWIIENVPSNAPWNEQKFEAKLGSYERSASTLSPFDDAYYFPK